MQPPDFVIVYHFANTCSAFLTTLVNQPIIMFLIYDFGITAVVIQLNICHDNL